MKKRESLIWVIFLKKREKRARLAVGEGIVSIGRCKEEIPPKKKNQKKWFSTHRQSRPTPNRVARGGVKKGKKAPEAGGSGGKKGGNGRIRGNRRRQSGVNSTQPHPTNLGQKSKAHRLILGTEKKSPERRKERRNYHTTQSKVTLFDRQQKTGGAT